MWLKIGLGLFIVTLLLLVAALVFSVLSDNNKKNQIDTGSVYDEVLQPIGSPPSTDMSSAEQRQLEYDAEQARMKEADRKQLEYAAEQTRMQEAYRKQSEYDAEQARMREVAVVIPDPITNCDFYKNDLIAAHKSKNPNVIINQQSISTHLSGTNKCWFGYKYNLDKIYGESSDTLKFDATPGGAWEVSNNINVGVDKPSFWFPKSEHKRSVQFSFSASVANTNKLRVRVFTRQDVCKDGIFYRKKAGCQNDKLIIDWKVTNVPRIFHLPMLNTEHFYIRTDASRKSDGNTPSLIINSLYLLDVPVGSPGKIVNLVPFLIKSKDNYQFYKNQFEIDTARKNVVARGICAWTGIYLPLTGHMTQGK
jgi:hypothetical protein